MYSSTGVDIDTCLMVYMSGVPCDPMFGTLVDITMFTVTIRTYLDIYGRHITMLLLRFVYRCTF